MAKIMNKLIPTHPAHLVFLPVFTTKMARHAPTKTQAPGGAPGSLATASEDTSLRVLNVSGLGKETHLGKFDHDRSLFSRSLESW